MKPDRFIKRITLSQEILTRISRIDQFKGVWQGSVRLSPQILNRLKSFVIITSTGASTRIEGSKMTDAEIGRFLRGLKTTQPAGRDEEEVAGYADVIGRIFDNWKEIRLSEGWILQLHAMLLQYSSKDKAHKGTYKRTDNTVVMINETGTPIPLFASTPPHLVAAEMQLVIDWTNEQLQNESVHPLLVIANFIFEFLAIHPFTDGNGRISRALTNLLLLKAGYSYVPYVSLDEIIEQTKTDYYLALRATQKNHKTKRENITPWVNYLLSILTKQVDGVEQIIHNDQPEKILSENQTFIYTIFSDGKDHAIADIVLVCKDAIPRDTIKKALARLVTLGLLEKIGEGRGTRYR